MIKQDDLPLYLCLYKLQRHLYLVVRNFSKSYKYTLGQSILDLNWKVLDLVIFANILPNQKKGEKILEASAAFDQMKTRLRLAYEEKLISPNKFSYIIEKNEEIGKMLTGWLKWARLAEAPTKRARLIKAKSPNISFGGHNGRSRYP